MILAHPRPQSDEYGATDAAWASCFVNTEEAEEAEARARELLAESGWDTEELEDCRSVQRSEYLDDPENLAKFDQALTDGVVITLHSWRIGAPDE